MKYFFIFSQSCSLSVNESIVLCYDPVQTKTGDIYPPPSHKCTALLPNESQLQSNVVITMQAPINILEPYFLFPNLKK